jgi:hypothetical protein
VHEEAKNARRRRILVPVLIEDVEPPLGFQSIQAASLANWDGKEPNQVFLKLIADVEALIGPPLKEAEEERKRADGECLTPGGGDQPKSEEQPRAKQIAHALEPALPSPDEGRDAVLNKDTPARLESKGRL